jgi:hypothetical protein
MLIDIHGQPLRSTLPPAGPPPQAFSPWFGTQASETRKPLYNFQADPARQLTPYARHSLDVQAQTLVANNGLAACLRSLARTVGFLTPQARTGDASYDAALEEAFARVANSPLIFDAAGADTFYSYQVATTETRLIRGDLFSLFTETTTGAARIASRGAQSVGGTPVKPIPGWFDGILSNDDGYPLAYNFLGANGSSQQVDARSVFHHRNRHALGAQRGVTSLSHALNHLRDMIETIAAWKSSIKTAAEVAITRKQDTPHGIAPSSLGLNGPIQSDPFSPPDFSPDPEATVPDLPVAFEEYMQSGLFSQVPLDVLHDDRPHPNALAFHDTLKKEVALGIGVPHQLLFFMDDPGGAWSRILLEALIKFIAAQYLDHLRPFCQRFWSYAISKEIKAGRLDPAPRRMSPQKMWNVRWTPPRSMSADLGRIGRLNIEMRKVFLTTAATHFEELGLDWEDEFTQGAKEIAFLRNLETSTPGLLPGDMTSWITPTPAAAPTASAEDLALLTTSLAEMREELRALRPTAT